ncbi:MAG: SRPBCC domain-containing protein [Chloroflexi bacterium]|nr:SRPBCC domain-containing protein [Chloroflexota bacterium]
MRELRSEIEIDAPPARVWAVLTDFDAYPGWNAFMTSIEGEAREGAKLSVRLEPPGWRAMTFAPTLLAVQPERELRWRGRLLLPGVFDGEHIFELHPRDGGGTRLVHREEFGGVLAWPILRMVGAKTLLGFEVMNAALKARSESPADAAPDTHGRTAEGG